MAGEVDLSGVDELRQAIDAALADAASVVIDFAGTTFIDGTGLSVLAWLAHEARDRGRGAQLRNVSARMRQLLELTRIDGEFPVTGA